MLLKKKSIQTKKELISQGKSHDVYFISLTSCNARGIPIHPTALFDLFSKQQMVKHNVIGMTVHDLYTAYKNSADSMDESKDFFHTSTNVSHDQKLRKLFKDVQEKAINGKMAGEEIIKIFQDNGINAVNAINEIRKRILDKTHQENCRVDIYNLLCWFVRQRREAKKPFHIFLDEFPLLQSRSSK